MYAHVSREEWLFRGLAIAMCLAMVGLTVMPLAVGEGLTALAIYYGDGSVGVGGAIIGAGLIKIIPELMEVGLITSATGVGAVILAGVAIAA